MTDTGLSRRLFLGATAATAAGGLAATADDLTATAKQAEGPFYPKHEQVDKDADMTQVDGQPGKATGERLKVSGRILDTDGNPVSGAVIDIWQADSKGRYLHEDAPESSPLDPGFQYWARLKTGEDGTYSVKTIKPAKYPAMGDWVRPPHIHFKVARRGMRELITQMYFKGDPLNAIDRLYLEAPEDTRHTIEIDPVEGKATFDIVLETV